MTDHEWTDWCNHDGKGVPAEVLGQFIEVDCKHGNGKIDRDQFWHPVSLDDDWENVWKIGFVSSKDSVPLVLILRYRIRKPRALQQMIERAAALPVVKVLEKVK